ncbi:MAG: S-methyl-5-thioribose-1-phosphate isomerase [Ignavibacteriales bacterium]|nr:S-methyl-5-thioribose-1-phosphate isomerase [Ignavibacteriales bacterium]
MRALEWRNRKVRFIDQTKLPLEEYFIETDDEVVVAHAIKSLAIRGAPLIGIAAAYGFVLALNKLSENETPKRSSHIEKTHNLFASTRPTAVNLFWALNRMKHIALRALNEPLATFKITVLAEAKAIHAEDEEMCRTIGAWGAEALPNAATILTHCNTGSLATGGAGTAQSVIATLWEQHKLKHVYIDETRPLLQGARLTAWELKNLGIPATLITDNTAAFLMQLGLINAIVVGADRIAANGDTANKVGTYSLAVLALHHAIPMYIAAPTSTIDFEITSGKEIPIEQRSGTEVTSILGKQIAPHGVEVYSPAFDVTPNELISGIITEQGVLRKPYREAIASLKISSSKGRE